MRKIILISAAVFLSCFAAKVNAQGKTLEFSRGLVVSSVPDTVPAGTIWKVTSVYGMERICIPNINPDYSTYPNSSKYVAYVGSGFSVNTNPVFSERKWDVPSTTNINVYNDAACTSKYSDYTKGWAAYDINPNPNILPMWIAEGSVVKTDAAKVFLSIIEFTIQ